MTEQGETFQVFGEYPHELMQHLLALLRTEEKKVDWLLTEEFYQKYFAKYFKYERDIRELKIAKEKDIIKTFFEKRRASEWEQRTFIRTALILLTKELKEYEAVELLESLMWVFGWDLVVEVSRKWETSEEDKANFHNFGDLHAFQRNGQAFDRGMKKHLDERNEVRGEEKEKEESEKEKSDRDKQRIPQSKENHKKKKSVQGKKQIISEKKTSNNHQEVKTELKQEVAVKDLVEVGHWSEEEYKKALQETKIKFERLMPLSVRKEIKKAKRGNPLSQTMLAEFYLEEDTKHTDYFEAARWYSFAVRQGNDKAKLELGKLFDSGRLFESVAEESLLDERVEAIQTKKYGIRYFKELAEAGYPTAQSILGMKYYLGDGVEKDTGKAVKWLKKAAIQGQVDAQRQLSEIYTGIDEKEAKKWSKMANREKEQFIRRR